jgi:hypothetical protein
MPRTAVTLFGAFCWSAELIWHPPEQRLRKMTLPIAWCAIAPDEVATVPHVPPLTPIG